MSRIHTLYYSGSYGRVVSVPALGHLIFIFISVAVVVMRVCALDSVLGQRWRHRRGKEERKKKCIDECTVPAAVVSAAKWQH